MRFNALGASPKDAPKGAPESLFKPFEQTAADCAVGATVCCRLRGRSNSLLQTARTRTFEQREGSFEQRVKSQTGSGCLNVQKNMNLLAKISDTVWLDF